MNSAARKLLSMRVRLGHTIRKLSSGYHGVPEEYKHLQGLTMNDYPVPKQFYKDVYARRQADYNKMLVASALFFASAVAVIYSTGTLDYLAPPPREVLDWK